MALPYQQTLDTLQKMFQFIDRETIGTVLLNNNGLIDPSVEQLLKLSEVPSDPLADQKMTIFTLNNANNMPAERPKEKPKENVPDKNVLSPEHEMNLIKQLQEKEDENIAISLQNHYITKANSDALQQIYEQDADEYLDPRILEDEEEDEDEENEAEARKTQPPKDNKKKPAPEDFGPMPKPIKQKKTFKEKLSSFFSRPKKKENVMGKHDAKKLQIKEQDIGEIISFEHQDSQPNKPTKKENK